MPGISRRNLIRSGLALSASAIASRSAFARAAARLAADAQAAAPVPASAAGPREQLLFDFDWKFMFGNGVDPAKDLGFGNGQGDFAKTGEFNFAKHGFDDSKWRTVNLPHDWAVELPFVWDQEQMSHGYKPLGRRYPETSVGWYRHEFDIPASDAGRRVSVEFDGAFRDILVFVNGCFIGRNDHGYAPFHFDITDFLAVGKRNYIVLRVDASFGDGWFYEGAGIYRHVWLTKTDPVHLGKWETYIRPSEVAANVTSSTLTLGTVVENQGNKAAQARVTWKILDPKGATVAMAEAPAQTIAADGKASYSASAKLMTPVLWSPDTPNLYTAEVSVSLGGKVVDAENVNFGIRTATFTADKGFFLNGQNIKIQGTCNHHDHAGVGAALPDRLQYFRAAVLKQMGCNGVRTSHNMPTPEWVQASERLGLMMMCETRQMSSSPEGLARLEVMIKRYRNSPCIILWSIGNEEGELQSPMAEEGAKIARTMVNRCHELDPTRVVSAAVNGDNSKESRTHSTSSASTTTSLRPIIIIRSILTSLFTVLKPPAPSPHAANTRQTSYAIFSAPTTLISLDGARPPRTGGLFMARASGRRAALHGPVSTIAVSPRLMAGLRSTRSSASSTCADFPRTPSITTRPGGVRSRCCTSSRIGISKAKKAMRSLCGFTRISIPSSCL